MIVGIGADVSYYVEPDAEQKAFLAAAGKTWQVIEPPVGMVVDAEGQVSDARMYNLIQSDPFIRGGGNPLYLDPSNIPAPNQPTFESCDPRDTACVGRNQAKETAWNDLALLYRQALNGAFDPQAPDRYMAALAQWPTGGSTPTSSSGPTANQPVTGGSVIRPTASTGSQAVVVPVSGSRPAAGTTAQPGVIPPSVSETVQAHPWILAAVAVGAILLFKGKN